MSQTASGLNATFFFPFRHSQTMQPDEKLKPCQLFVPMKDAHGQALSRNMRCVMLNDRRSYHEPPSRIPDAGTDYTGYIMHNL